MFQRFGLRDRFHRFGSIGSQLLGSLMELFFSCFSGWGGTAGRPQPANATGAKVTKKNNLEAKTNQSSKPRNESGRKSDEHVVANEVTTNHPLYEHLCSLCSALCGYWWSQSLGCMRSPGPVAPRWCSETSYEYKE